MEAKTISRRPAAVVGILMALSVGAVAYGTFDDAQAPLSGELMNAEKPVTYFDVLAEQMARNSTQQNVHRENLEPSIPVNPRTYDTAPASLPVNQHVIGANVTETFHSGAPRPVQQPQTGAGMLWITLIGALAGILWKSRGMLKT
jgi:hypothetical protein